MMLSVRAARCARSSSEAKSLESTGTIMLMSSSRSVLRLVVLVVLAFSGVTIGCEFDDASCTICAFFCGYFPPLFFRRGEALLLRSPEPTDMFIVEPSENWGVSSTISMVGFPFSLLFCISVALCVGGLDRCLAARLCALLRLLCIPGRPVVLTTWAFEKMLTVAP